MLPVGNRPLVSYVLDLLEQSNLKDIIVVRFFAFDCFLIGKMAKLCCNILVFDYKILGNFVNFRWLEVQMLLLKLVHGFRVLMSIVFVLRLFVIPTFHWCNSFWVLFMFTC